MAKQVIVDQNGVRQPKKPPTEQELKDRKTKKPGGANGGSGDNEE